MTYPGLHHPSRRTDAARTLRHTRRTFASCREQEATLTPDMVDLAVQEGACDNTPFPLSQCYASFSTLLRRRREISPVGRNRPFFCLLQSKETIFRPFS